MVQVAPFHVEWKISMSSFVVEFPSVSWLHVAMALLLSKSKLRGSAMSMSFRARVGVVHVEPFHME